VINVKVFQTKINLTSPHQETSPVSMQAYT